LTFSSVSEAKSAASTPAHPAQAPIAAKTDSRLKEQPSDLLFTDAAPAPSVAKAPSARVSEPAAPAIAATKVKPAQVPTPASLPAKSALDAAQLQIPAWLEPLARNTATASTQELIEKEKAKRVAEQAKEELEVVEDISAETVSPVEEGQVSEFEALTFDDTLSSEENPTDESDSNSPDKGRMLAAMAAGVLLLAGGAWWYMRSSSKGVVASPTAAVKSQTQTSASGAAVHAESLLPQSGGVLPVSSPVATSPADRLDPNSQSKPTQNGVGSAPANGPAAIARNDKAAASPASGGLSPVTITSTQPAAKQPKKPALGQIRLATPTVRKRGGTQDNGEADAALVLNSDKSESNTDALGSGLAVNSTGLATPAAPVPVGGDVRPAKLITSVAPVYPTLAKSQHVSGSVLIDALIDATGHVIAMKVVSGPTLLHQSAMDALRQWKYQPALLDGRAVPMHLTVTIQFRMQ
jgi:TonB family protein